MTDEAKNQLQVELMHAGEVSEVTPVLQELDRHRITSVTDVPQEEFLMRLFGKPCLPRRDLTTITGQEKCGKTFFTSMLMACCAERRVLELERIREERLRVLWYDTEQSLQSTKGILAERVARLVEGDFPDDSFFVFNVRSSTCEERMEMLVAGIEAYHPDLVIIDNISDLLPNVNDSEASVRIIGQLMQLASTHDCNITTVIHLNRSGEKRNLRGWLGTELLHKSFEAYYCEQIQKTDVFSVEQTYTRKYHIPETLYYEITDEGLPAVTARPDVQPRDEQGKYTTSRAEPYQIMADKVESFCQDYIIRHAGNARSAWEWNLRKLFGDAMDRRAIMSCDDLRNAVMRLSGIQQPKYYEKVFRLAVDQRIVRTTLDRNGRVVVIPSST